MNSEHYKPIDSLDLETIVKINDIEKFKEYLQIWNQLLLNQNLSTIDIHYKKEANIQEILNRIVSKDNPEYLTCLLNFISQQHKIPVIEVINTLSTSEKTLIHYIVKNKSINCLKELIKLGANIEIINDKLETPLHLAAALDNQHAVKLLIENGGNIYAKDKKDKSPAIKISEEEVAQWKKNYLHSIFQQTNSPKIKQMLQQETLDLLNDDIQLKLITIAAEEKDLALFIKLTEYYLYQDNKKKSETIVTLINKHLLLNEAIKYNDGEKTNKLIGWGANYKLNDLEEMAKKNDNINKRITFFKMLLSLFPNSTVTSHKTYKSITNWAKEYEQWFKQQYENLELFSKAIGINRIERFILGSASEQMINILVKGFMESSSSILTEYDDNKPIQQINRFFNLFPAIKPVYYERAKDALLLTLDKLPIRTPENKELKPGIWKETFCQRFSPWLCLATQEEIVAVIKDHQIIPRIVSANWNNCLIWLFKVNSEAFNEGLSLLVDDKYTVLQVAVTADSSLCIDFLLKQGSLDYEKSNQKEDGILHFAKADVQYKILKYVINHKKWEKLQELMKPNEQGNEPQLFKMAGEAYFLCQYEINNKSINQLDLSFKRLKLDKYSDKSIQKVNKEIKNLIQELKNLDSKHMTLILKSYDLKEQEQNNIHIQLKQIDINIKKLLAHYQTQKKYVDELIVRCENHESIKFFMTQLLEINKSNENEKTTSFIELFKRVYTHKELYLTPDINTGKNIFHILAEKGCNVTLASLVEVMKNFGALEDYLNAKDKLGYTPIQYSVINLNMRTTVFLLGLEKNSKKMVDISIIDKHQNNLLHLASMTAAKGFLKQTYAIIRKIEKESDARKQDLMIKNKKGEFYFNCHSDVDKKFSMQFQHIKAQIEEKPQMIKLIGLLEKFLKNENKIVEMNNPSETTNIININSNLELLESIKNRIIQLKNEKMNIPYLYQHKELIADHHSCHMDLINVLYTILDNFILNNNFDAIVENTKNQKEEIKKIKKIKGLDINYDQFHKKLDYLDVILSSHQEFTKKRSILKENMPINKGLLEYFIHICNAKNQENEVKKLFQEIVANATNQQKNQTAQYLIELIKKGKAKGEEILNFVNSYTVDKIFIRSLNNALPYSVIHYLAKIGDLNTIQMLLKNEKLGYIVKDLLNQSDSSPEKQTPLHYASINGHTKVVDWLMSEILKDGKLPSKNSKDQFPFDKSIAENKIYEIFRFKAHKLLSIYHYHQLILNELKLIQEKQIKTSINLSDIENKLVKVDFNIDFKYQFDDKQLLDNTFFHLTRSMSDSYQFVECLCKGEKLDDLTKQAEININLYRQIMEAKNKVLAEEELALKTKLEREANIQQADKIKEETKLLLSICQKGISHLTKEKSPFEMEYIKLEQQLQELGSVLSDNLQFKEHVDTFTNKIKLHYIGQLKRNQLTIEALLNEFKTYNAQNLTNQKKLDEILLIHFDNMSLEQLISMKSHVEQLGQELHAAVKVLRQTPKEIETNPIIQDLVLPEIQENQSISSAIENNNLFTDEEKIEPVQQANIQSEITNALEKSSAETINIQQDEIIPHIIELPKEESTIPINVQNTLNEAPLLPKAEVKNQQQIEQDRKKQDLVNAINKAKKACYDWDKKLALLSGKHYVGVFEENTYSQQSNEDCIVILKKAVKEEAHLKQETLTKFKETLNELNTLETLFNEIKAENNSKYENLLTSLNNLNTSLKSLLKHSIETLTIENVKTLAKLINEKNNNIEIAFGRLVINDYIIKNNAMTDKIQKLKTNINLIPPKFTGNESMLFKMTTLKKYYQTISQMYAKLAAAHQQELNKKIENEKARQEKIKGAIAKQEAINLKKKVAASTVSISTQQLQIEENNQTEQTPKSIPLQPDSTADNAEKPKAQMNKMGASTVQEKDTKKNLHQIVGASNPKKKEKNSKLKLKLRSEQKIKKTSNVSMLPVNANHIVSQPPIVPKLSETANQIPPQQQIGAFSIFNSTSNNISNTTSEPMNSNELITAIDNINLKLQLLKKMQNHHKTWLALQTLHTSYPDEFLMKFQKELIELRRMVGCPSYEKIDNSTIYSPININGIVQDNLPTNCINNTLDNYSLIELAKVVESKANSVLVGLQEKEASLSKEIHRSGDKYKKNK